MRKRPPYARIAVTVPPEDLTAADELATTLDRSRSWVFAEAVRQFVKSHGEPPTPPARLPGLGDSRLMQLQRDLALTPEQRIMIAEQTLRNAPPLQSPQGSQYFDRYEDFLDWKIHRGLKP